MKYRLILFLLPALLCSAQDNGEKTVDASPFKDALPAFELLTGLTFTDAERELMARDLMERVDQYRAVREVKLDNSVPPALLFQPEPPKDRLPQKAEPPQWSKGVLLERPDNLEDVAYWTIRDLAAMLRSGKITSVELTRMYLDRLKRHSETLKCVVTLLESSALEQAAQADREIKAGRYRGLLHGIPYGAKDLFALKGVKTTWGAVPYRDQIIDDTATVIGRLDEAGAVLAAKLSMGALAWGDVWFDGTTKNPWNLEQGSSGSSAGSASATSAGLVPFALGTETWGSIVSPSTRCGVTGLRPTFGRVSRAGAMALSWSMDKIGPICRDVEDCAIVFEAIRGADGIDRTVIDQPFNYKPGVSLRDLRIGYVKSAFEAEGEGRDLDQAVLKQLRDLGAELIPIELPADLPIRQLSFILSAEAAASFDALTRSNQDDLLVRQIRYAWPNSFRAARSIPAVEYLNANRIRQLLMAQMDKLFEKIDVYVCPSFGGDNLLLTNLTGHPCVVLPNGFTKENAPYSITFTGDLFNEAEVLGVAKAYQDATEHHKKRPAGF